MRACARWYNMLYTHDELHDELQRHTPTTYSATAAAGAAAAASSGNARCCFVGSLSLCCTTLGLFSGLLLGDVASSSRGRVVAPPVEPSGADAAGAAAMHEAMPPLTRPWCFVTEKGRERCLPPGQPNHSPTHPLTHSHPPERISPDRSLCTHF